MKFASKRTGFTLIELLIATAIAAGVISMAFGANMLVVSSVRRLSAGLEHTEKTDVIIHNITKQLSSMYPVDVNSSNSTDKQQDKQNLLAFDGNFSSKGLVMSFISTAALLEHEIDTPVHVRYIYEPAAGRLVISESPYMDNTRANDRQPATQTLLENVDDISAEFFDGYQWHKKWQISDALPRAVKLTLTLNGPGSRQTQHEICTPIVCSTTEPRQLIIESRARQ